MKFGCKILKNGSNLDIVYFILKTSLKQNEIPEDIVLEIPLE